jgi:adenylosuccinate synthase
MNYLIVGGQFGDEGKGKIVDLLVQDKKIDVVVRYNGGNNAGHTIVLDDGKYPLHLLPSGILHSHVENVIGAGVVVDPVALVKEIHNLRGRGIECKNLRVSDRAQMVMPWHRAVDAHLGGRIGTTARGIGPCYEDRASRRGIRIGDLVDDCGEVDVAHFSAKVREVCADKNLILTKVYDLEPLDPESIIADYVAAAHEFKSQVCDTGALVERFHSENRTFLYEGAQGALLDIDWGTYPYVTSSSVGLAGCVAGSGYALWPDLRLGIVKAYATRVGEGPFVAELGAYEKIKVDDKVAPGQVLPPLTEAEKASALAGDEYLMGRWLRSVGAEFGTTTGRPRRCGWLDLVAVRHSIRVSGLNGIALTKLDVLNGIPKIKVCVGYHYQHKAWTDFPARIHKLGEHQPIYEELPGWEDLGNAKTYDELPANAKAYIEFIEKQTGIPVKIVSIGGHRNESLWRF